MFEPLKVYCRIKRTAHKAKQDKRKAERLLVAPSQQMATSLLQIVYKNQTAHRKMINNDNNRKTEAPPSNGQWGGRVVLSKLPVPGRPT